ncbi:hypothetical protein K437DRAFT_253889 [Tilletiaria anomala UBC 951]|uniref:Uncharacterized protein n=1 Tax=Tilletiaria anomala (strain ATCC 24038 / CBS 436.72 / UBC 951) TaxID=1037660 RepID=A0A066WNW4_TILAU|nr:uncharacterized protein K437DRAFT_253889 [Tilletiaria anomala UBC 951]KDN52694.1 hypothetical protein K437DRAFT_253889 [Tilletiaria anomala UBC 951]
MTSKGNTRPRSHLSDVVSNLVRSSLGQDASSIPPGLKGDDLDRYIADLIAKEAKQRNDPTISSSRNAREEPSTTRAAPTNKQFLSNLIRATEGHNRSVIRHLEKEAHAGQRERTRAEQHGDSDLTFFQSSPKRQDLLNRSQEGPNRCTRALGRVPENGHPRQPSTRMSTRMGHSDAKARGKMRAFSDEEDSEHSREVIFDDPRGAKPAQSSMPRSRHGVRDRSEERTRDAVAPRRHRYRGGSRSASPPPRKTSARDIFPERGNVSHSADLPPSKMDKYFAADYDPRLDIGRDSIEAVTDPRTGLVGDAGWDQMLSVILEKEDAKAERRRLEKEERRCEKEARREERRRRRERRSRASSSSEDDGATSQRKGSSGRDRHKESKKRSRDSERGDRTHGHDHSDILPSRSPSPSPHRSKLQSVREEASDSRKPTSSTELIEMRYPKTREWDMGKRDQSF